MNDSRNKSIALHPLLWAIAGGLCLAASFPKFGVAGFAWIAPGLILFGGLLEPRHAFRTGYLAGLAHYLASLYWLLNIPVAFAPILGWFSLSAYLALYTGAWVWLCIRLAPKALPRPWHDGSIGLTSGPISPLPTPSPAPLSLAPRLPRLRWALLCAASWVAMEMLIGRVFSGFPWNLLGTSQYRQLPVIQIAATTGLEGVSFLIVWLSIALLGAVLVFWRAPRSRAWRVDLILPVIALVAVVTSGMGKLFQARPSERFLKVALVQPSIPQTLIWDANENTNRFRKLVELSERALATKPDVLLWPEASVPNLLRYDQATLEAVTGLAKKHGVWMIIGADDAEPRRGDPTGKEADYFNAAFLITPAGEIVAKYNKQRLVIFGEYIPLIRWLPFLKWFTPITSGFASGTGPVAFELTRPRTKTAVLICFEDVFGFLARRYVDPDTDFLINLTNNGWFGEGAAQWQHAAASVFRAVENGLPLVRCTNNGLTCWVDRFGALHDVGAGEGNIYGEGFRLARIPLLPEGVRRAPTIYRQYGDWFGWTCVGITALMLARVWVEKKKARG